MSGRLIYILFNANRVGASAKVARIVMDRELPVGSVVHLPAPSGRSKMVVVEEGMTGVWQIVSPPEIMVMPRFENGGNIRKVWVRRLTSDERDGLGSEPTDKERVEYAMLWEDRPPLADLALTRLI